MTTADKTGDFMTHFNDYVDLFLSSGSCQVVRGHKNIRRNAYSIRLNMRQDHRCPMCGDTFEIEEGLVIFHYYFESEDDDEFTSEDDYYDDYNDNSYDSY